MTDNEIVNALECCIDMDCHICPFMINSKECNNIESLVLDLINRQKEEIEKLKTQLGKSENFFTIKLDKEQLNDIVKSQLEKFEVDAVTVKNEIIREFAEKLKHKCRDSVELDDYRITVVTKSDIDDLVREVIGDT